MKDIKPKIEDIKKSCEMLDKEFGSREEKWYTYIC